MTATDPTRVDLPKVRDELHRPIDQPRAGEAVAALDHVKWPLSDDEAPTEEGWKDVRRGEQEIARGEYATWEDSEERLAHGRAG